MRPSPSIALLAIALGLLLALPAHASQAPAPGSPLPAFSVRSLDGRAVTAADLGRGRITVLEFIRSGEW